MSFKVPADIPRSGSQGILDPFPPSKLAVNVEGLSKCYRIYEHPRHRLLQTLWGNRRQYYKEFWALHELSFQLQRGETLGVVGRNGSGKSTLLQLICGTLTPSTGRVEVQGRIGALLELASGFNPEFTGRENVFLNGSVLGLSQAEIEQRLDTILTFADIGPFIDQPVKTYSSGMAIRLAFAVQAHVDPDVLVVDEALAVGDELFQRKCYAHLEQLKARGTSILLVSHSCPQIVQHCDQALLLHKGRARLWGKPQRITVVYQRLSNASDQEWDQALAELNETATTRPSLGQGLGEEVSRQEEMRILEPLPGSEQVEAWLDRSLQPSSTVIYPARGARIESLSIETAGGQPANILPYGLDFALRFDYQAEDSLPGLAFGCHIVSHDGQRVSGQVFPEQRETLNNVQAGDRWTIRFSFRGGLWPGMYFVGGGIWVPGDSNLFLHRVVDFRALRILANGQIIAIGACNLQGGPAKLTSSGVQRLTAAETTNQPTEMETKP